MTDLHFPPNRTAALERLQSFLPSSAGLYAGKRNYDLQPDGASGVSQLSPYIRHRILPETEVLQAVLGRYSISSADKFIQEVLWRTYWKGWLEQRPEVWAWYCNDLQQQINNLQTQAGLRSAWEDACNGMTGLECFDHWANQLVETGYLHNHARMWFASIWIFTLRLPWELGADFFMRHLLDGDPASNTLSWRWVAGLQTKGKTYLARADNIEKYTQGRFSPTGLAKSAPPLEGKDHPHIRNLPKQHTYDFSQRTGILLTEDDMNPTHLTPPKNQSLPIAGLLATQKRSPLKTSDAVNKFTQAAMEDALNRHSRGDKNCHILSDVEKVATWAAENDLQQIVTPYAPVGPSSTALKALRKALSSRDIHLVEHQRSLDLIAWPHAKKGFFAFRKNIPEILEFLKIG